MEHGPDPAAEEREEATVVGVVAPHQWWLVLANDARGELLEVARSGDWGQVCAFLALLEAAQEAA